MSLTNPNKVITEERLSAFYQDILPYLGGMPEILANKFSKGDLYSTDEKMIGVWTNNKPLYQKVFVTTSAITLNPNGYTRVFTPPANIEEVVDMQCNSSQFHFWYWGTDCGTFASTYAGLNVVAAGTSFTLQYTKTTDSAISIGVDTDYSTTEKIVGTWIDGSYIYKKTFTGTIPENGSITLYAADLVNGITNVIHHEIAFKPAQYGSSVPGYISTKATNAAGTQSIVCDTLGFAMSDPSDLARWFRFVLTNGTGRTCDYALTLQYTKTS